MKIHVFLIPVLLFAAFTAGCGKGSQAQPGADPSPEAPRKVTHVEVQVVAKENLRQTFTLPGVLEAWEDLRLAAELDGPVKWIGPSEGDRVRRGEEILRIDPETVTANLAREQAEYDKVSRNFERIKELLADKIVSEKEYDEARSACDVARAELRRTEVECEKSTLSSPVDGVLDELLVDRGEYVSVGTPVAVVVDVDRLKALVEVPEKDVPYLRVGEKVKVLPAIIDGTAQARSGEIIHVSFRADPETRTYLAKIAVDNSSGGLRPGMILRVEFVRRTFEQVVSVPLYAVIERNGQKAVFVEEAGVARLRPVETGTVIGDRVVVEKGISAGERLIVKGQHLVGDGAAVSVVEG